jgi:Uma2 family endonuclease
MAGASLAHNRIVANLLRVLGSALRGKPCAPYPSDLRVRLPSGDRYVYPDVTVICDPVELTDEHQDVVLNPRVVIEVLSDSPGSSDTNAPLEAPEGGASSLRSAQTGALVASGFDRGPKFEDYRGMPSVQEILFVSRDHRLIEHYARTEGAWTLREHRVGDVVKLVSVPATLALDEVYEGLALA